MDFTYDIDNFRLSFEHEMTWLNGFLRNTTRYGKKNAMVYSNTGQSWTYAELNRDANKLANAFLDDGIKKNDVIMHMLFNSPEFIFCYLAGHKTGAINCPINYRLAPGELALLLEDSKPEFFVYDNFFADTVREALKISNFRPKRLLYVDSGGKIAPSSILFSEYVKNGSTDNPAFNVLPHIYDETTRLYTSGTTNKAKAVPINSINELFSAHDVIMHYPLTPEDRTLNLTPWFHRGGIHIGGPTATLYVGGEVVIMKEFNPKMTLEVIKKYKVNFITGVPSIFQLLARAQKSSPLDVSSLKGLCSMGSPFSKAELLEYRGLFTPNILNGYGTTETFVNVYMRPYSPIEKCSATGQSCVDDEVRIVKAIADGFGDPDDLVPKNNRDIGEIIIKAPHKSTGCYVNNPEMTNKKFYKNFHYTGDIGIWDEDGFITVLSRKDDMIISASENIYPAQIEAALNEHPKVAESAVIGVPDKLHGQRVSAYIVPLDDSLTIEDLKEWCIRHPMLPTYKHPKIYTFVDALPHTATGKLMHYKLRESAAGGKA
ncbi:MAG: AMP-binding protein [Desulfovibrio sp.]|nr:AMP-binding protein [Desulfovibrio sp.]